MSRQLKWSAAVFGLSILIAARAVLATEAGTSLYLPGAYNDFSAAVFGPAGIHFRNDFHPHHGKVSRAIVGGRLLHDVDHRVWTNTFKFSLFTDARIFGGRYGAALAVPILFHARAEGFLETPDGRMRQRDRVAGLGDLYLTPARLNWRWGDHHLTLGQSVFAPTGSYEAGRVINLGRNHWGFDSHLSYTWLHARGHELSLTAGYLVNTRNPATRYRSGDEFHLDSLLAQRFTPRLAVGVPGYWYRQLTSDDARILRDLGLGGFRGESAGIGLAVLYNPTIGGTETRLVLKWVHDVHARRRAQGSGIMLAAAFDLWSWRAGSGSPAAP